MERQYAWQKDIFKIEKITEVRDRLLISVAMDTSRHLMHYNAGEYVK